MSVTYTLPMSSPYGEASVAITRMRWDRPAFPIDASPARVRAARAADAPAVLVAPLDEQTGFGPSQLIALRSSRFGPYADLLVLSGSNVTSDVLSALAEQVVPTRALPRIDLLDQGPRSRRIRMLPPASHGSGTVRAKLTDDWHCSRVSGDSCPSSRARTCTPGAYGHSSCSALDWNRGSPVIGENVYFRALGRASPRAHVVQARPSAYMQTCHVVQVQIADGGEAIGSLRYQHISRLADPFEVALGDDEDLLNETLIGETVNEARLAPGCPWSGSHVHEDDSAARAWKAWNADRYRRRAGSRFDVRAPGNWIRTLSWTIDD